MWQAISQQLSDTLLFEYQITEKVRLSGGDISESYMINDGEQLEVDYPRGIVSNPQSGKSVALRKYPAAIEEIFECGGLPQFAYERYQRKRALANSSAMKEDGKNG